VMDIRVINWCKLLTVRLSPNGLRQCQIKIKRHNK